MRSVRSVHRVAAVVATAVAAIAAGGALGAPATTARGLPPPDLDAAVARTIAAGSARVTGTAAMAGATTAALDGVTSFTTGASAFTVRGSLDGVTTEVEVRSTPDGTWLRMAPDPTWIPVGGDVASIAATDAGWSDLLGRLRGATRLVTIGGGGRRLRGTTGPQELDVELDGAGRIVRVRLHGDGNALDLRLHDLGAPVDVAPPGGAAPREP